MVDTTNNVIQVINEVVVLISVWLMFHFTLFVGEAQTRYDLAWNFLYIVGADVVINILLLFYFVANKIYGACKRKFMARKARKMAK